MGSSTGLLRYLEMESKMMRLDDAGDDVAADRPSQRDGQRVVRAVGR